MDKFWSIFAFPIGLLLSFGPIMIVWLKAELKDESAEKKKNHR